MQPHDLALALTGTPSEPTNPEIAPIGQRYRRQVAAHEQPSMPETPRNAAHSLLSLVVV